MLGADWKPTVPKGTASIVIERSAEDVFDLIHDYSRRLEWDTLLRSAKLLGNATRAAAGEVCRCTGKWSVGGMALETKYVTFKRPIVAAILLVNSPPFFSQFAATLRHKRIEPHKSEVQYIYFFRAKPRFLAALLEPIMHIVLAREIRHRLASLKRFMETEPGTVLQTQ